MTLRYKEMDKKDALYKIARQYKGGVGALALRMGRTEAVLYNKLRPSIDTHQVTIDEFEEIMEFAQDVGIKDALLPLDAIEWHFRRFAIPIPEPTERTEAELENCVCRVVKEIGDIAAVQTKALEDKRIDDQEFDQLKREFTEAHAALAEWFERIRERHEAGKAKGRA